MIPQAYEGLALYLERAANPRPPADDREGRITSNLKLVVYIARSYARDVEQLLELIQEGNAGLIQAADSYAADRGPFGPWAGKWIRGSIRNSLQGADWLDEYARHGKTKDKAVYLAEMPEGFQEPLCARSNPENNVWLLVGSQSLTQKQRAVLAGRLAGYSLTEIADQQGVTHQAIRSVEQTAIKRLSSD